MDHFARPPQVAADGAVIETPAEPCQQDAGKGQCEGDGPHVIHYCYGHKVTAEADMGIEEIHQWVVDRIERLTEFA